MQLYLGQNPRGVDFRVPDCMGQLCYAVSNIIEHT